MIPQKYRKYVVPAITGIAGSVGYTAYRGAKGLVSGAHYQSAKGAVGLYSGSRNRVASSQHAMRAATVARARATKVLTLPRGSRKGSNSGPGRSGGKIRKLRKVRKTRARKLNKKGVDFTRETGGKVEAQDCVYLGHITAPIQDLKKQAAYALMKQLFLKAGEDVGSLDLPMSHINSADKVNVVFSYTPESAMAIETYSFPGGLGTNTLTALVDWFINAARGWNLNTVDTADQTEVYSIQFTPESIGTTGYTLLSPALLMMKQCRVHFDAKSALKMQNRTITSTGNDEAFDVDNCPIYGMSYEGHGQGTRFIKRDQGGARPAFVGHKENGTILVTPSQDDAPVEPPEPENFDKVTREGRIKLEPGEIKTSTLTWKTSMLFNEFWNKTTPNPASTNKVMKRMGKFRFFAIEKMIHFTNTNTAIRTAYEINYDLSTHVTFRRSLQSTKMFLSARDVNNIEGEG